MCRSSSDDDPPIIYEVTVVEEDPGTVRSVTATAYNATDDVAADFFSYVAELSLEDVDPINPETWVAGSISSGGQYLAEGAELKLYGIEGARTLEIFGTASPTEESQRKGLRPKAGPTGKTGAREGTSG